MHSIDKGELLQGQDVVQPHRHGYSLAISVTVAILIEIAHTIHILQIQPAYETFPRHHHVFIS